MDAGTGGTFESCRGHFSDVAKSVLTSGFTTIPEPNCCEFLPFALCYKELLPRNCCPRPLRQQTRPRWPHWLTGERECGRIGSTGSPTGSAPATVSLSEVPAAACMCSF